MAAEAVSEGGTPAGADHGTHENGGRAVRVLVNALHARSGGGLTYLRNMLPALAADPGLETHLALHENQRHLLVPMAEGVHVHAFRFRDGFYRRLVWEQMALPVIARRLAVDVTFSPANFGPLLGPAPVILLRNALTVVETERRFQKRIYWAALAAMTAVSLLGCRRAIAVSEYARASLTRRLPEGVRGRVDVIHHGVDPIYSPPPEGQAREDFLLAVADLYVQKNLHGLLLAVDELRRDFPAIRLRIAGSPVDPDYAERISAMVARRGLGGHVRFLGHVPAAELAEHYRRCAVFVFPSLVETFGNPLVEAMASGAPIVSADAAAMPEVLGDAALYFDPRDPHAMAESIASALGDDGLRRRLGKRALARARRFSWPETAHRTADVIKACGGSA